MTDIPLPLDYQERLFPKLFTNSAHKSLHLWPNRLLKHLIYWPRQAIFQSNGRPLGDCWMKIARYGVLGIAIILGGCEADTDDGDRKSLPNCGYEEGNDLPVSVPASGSKRSGWRDEGNGFISNESSTWYAPHVLEPGIDYASLNQSESRILHCPTGDRIQIKTVGVPTVSLLDNAEFIQLLRERQMFKSNYEYVPTIIALAKSFKLQAVPTRATKDSEVAMCGCRAHYPDLDLSWADGED